MYDFYITCMNFNHLDLPISVIPYLPLGVSSKSLLGEALEAPAFCYFFERDPDYANLPRKGSQIWTILIRTSMADENLKVSPPPPQVKISEWSLTLCTSLLQDSLLGLLGTKPVMLNHFGVCLLD